MLPKAMLEADVFTSVPLPVACVSSGLAGSLLITTSVLFLPPTVCGENETMMVQLAPLASTPPDNGHVPPVMEKSVVPVR